MAVPYKNAPESPRAGFRVIRDEDAPAYDGQAQEKREPFLMVTWELYDRLEGEGAAQLVLLALMRHANGGGECWPSIEAICKHTGKSDRFVRDAINRLVELKIITKEPRNVGGMKSVNTYRICKKSPDNQSGTMYRTSGKYCRTDRQIVPDRAVHSADKQEPVEPEPIEPVIPSGSNEPVSPPVKPKKAPSYTPDFLTRFWSAYPPQTRNTKTDAFAVWERMTPQERDEAVRVLPLFVATDSWQRGFAPAAQRWLSKRKWEDPPPAIEAGTLFNGFTAAEIAAEEAKWRNGAIQP